jgi:hypothetical protein
MAERRKRARPEDPFQKELRVMMLSKVMGRRLMNGQVVKVRRSRSETRLKSSVHLGPDRDPDDVFAYS